MINDAVMTKYKLLCGLEIILKDDFMTNLR
jgi:hypothetical protein